MNALEIRGLRKERGSFALTGLDLTLPGGCIMGLIGENGAGKSTTIRLLLEMIRKDGGEVAFFGREQEEYLASSRHELGVVLDEVGISGCLKAAQVERVMAAAFPNWDSAEFNRLVRKLDIPTDKGFSKLSRGNQMKLGLAVALSHHAKLLILDEATNGLDPVVREEVVELIRDFVSDEEHAVLISSHIVSDLEKICDYIAFLHKGKLLLCEEKDRLSEDYALIHVSAGELAEIEPAAVLGSRITPYGAEAIVRSTAVPEGAEKRKVDIEQLFITMVKEDR
ncbi:MAG: ABC transporter ATP-binding protein [Oscillospiraceae bacterium]|nr:ABC transporter ATP-binding protein [Oscillospiraceae bacterium]